MKKQKQVIIERIEDDWVVYVREGKAEYFRVRCDSLDDAMEEVRKLCLTQLNK